MSDVVEMGPPAPEPSGPISYPVGPSQLRRVFRVAAMPPALGIGSLALSLASLLIVQAASEVGDVHVIAHGSRTTMAVYRWGGGLRLGLAALALVLAVVGIRGLIGKRPRLTVEPEDFESDERTVDELEAAALARVAAPPAWMAAVLGAALIVALVALALNAAAFGYAMASDPPAPQSPFTTF